LAAFCGDLSGTVGRASCRSFGGLSSSALPGRRGKRRGAEAMSSPLEASRAPRRQQAVPFLAPPSGSLQTKEAHHANSRFTSAQLIGLQRPVPGQNRAPGRLHKRLSGTSSKNKKMRRTRGTRDRRLGLVFWTNQGVAD